MRRLWIVVAAMLGLIAAPLLAQQAELPPQARQLVDSLHPQMGTIPIVEAKVTLDLGDKYVFYGADDARRILVEAWGNPPAEGEGVLGLIMPAGTTPYSDAWGAVVTYEETGHVDNSDAREADYGELLTQMKEGAAAANEERRSGGYPTVDIIGWAQSPSYDSVSHSVVWARELAFEGEEVRSLNYDLRTLGRTGVLSVNFISSMPELPEIRTAAADLASLARFDAGASYDDFDSSVDEEAGYGIAGLVAGGVGLAVAKKAGLLVLLLKFIKPLLLGAAVLFGVFAGRIKRLFGAGKDEAEVEEPHDPQNPV